MEFKTFGKGYELVFGVGMPTWLPLSILMSILICFNIILLLSILNLIIER